MNTRGIVGRKIVAIKQYHPGQNANVGGVVAVKYIELDNGIRLYPSTIEGEADYHTELIVNRTNQKRRTKKTATENEHEPEEQD